jgi:gentisate 1,2-dioxygenase
MSGTAKFVEPNYEPLKVEKMWPALLIPREQIEAEIERLATSTMPKGGRRATKIVHPNAIAPGLGLAPGIDVTVTVLKPGETTPPIRHNSNQVTMCIRGAGSANIAGTSFMVSKYDVWNTPSMNIYTYDNTGRDLMVRLTYSNAPLLEKLSIHFLEDRVNQVAGPRAISATKSESFQRAKELARTFPLDENGGYLMPYEHLIDPEVVENKPLLWRWDMVQLHLHKISLGQEYSGRRVFCLYNPATGRANGTTHSFFATMGVLPPNVHDKPHRHSSAAINYYFVGSGFSDVEGEHFEWKAGDLMFSAPGWAAHAHGSREGNVTLTVQDHPFQIATESLIWQESLEAPVLVLGAQSGFETNIGALTARS